MKTAIFYASTTGNTASVAQMISESLENTELIDIADEGISAISEYDNVIIGTPTWGEGDLQDDFDEYWDQFCDTDFSGKKVALFGLGDQYNYGEYFLDAMGIIYERIIQNGARVVGDFEIDEDFDFEYSKAVKDGKFVGLAIDEDNQSEFTQRRIENWCLNIKKSLLNG